MYRIQNSNKNKDWMEIKPWSEISNVERFISMVMISSEENLQQNKI